jgi:release factor glutamine methyltransferase
MTCKDAYQWAQERLMKAGIEEAPVDTALLLKACCGLSRSDLLAFGEREIPEDKYQEFRLAIEKRETRIPLQLITGVQEFMGLEFLVSDKVLIPRVDTEFVTEEVLKWLQDDMKILDLCTGSGCILISLLYYSNGCKGVGTDISPDALALARANADRLLEADKEKVNWVRGDLFDGLSGDGWSGGTNGTDNMRYCRFDRIVANPPYIPTSVIPTLMPEVRLHEPITALDGGADGLEFYRRIIGSAKQYLEHEGMLFLEIGHDQGESVRQLLTEENYKDVQILRDYAGCNRVAMGTWRVSTNSML